MFAYDEFPLISAYVNFSFCLRVLLRLPRASVHLTSGGYGDCGSCWTAAASIFCEQGERHCLNGGLPYLRQGAPQSISCQCMTWFAGDACEIDLLRKFLLLFLPLTVLYES